MISLENRLSDAACFLLQLAGGRLNYTKLIKLLYISDRESLRNHGYAISGDRYVSMNNGPVLSHLLNLIKGKAPSQLWNDHFQTVGYDLHLVSPASCGDLSEGERETLIEVFRRFESFSYGEMIDFVHGFPEWTNPNGSCTPIGIEKILKCAGMENEPAEALAAEIETDRKLMELFA